jgi:hypothetical protein
MPNLTITAEQEVPRWARIRTAEENTSVARLVGDLKEQMQEERCYENAERRTNAGLPGDHRASFVHLCGSPRQSGVRAWLQDDAISATASPPASPLLLGLLR